MANRKNRVIVPVEHITVRQLKGLFSKGRIASVNFTKKKDGSNRTINGKTTVVSAMVGGEPAYDAESRGQIRVCDLNLRDENGKRTKGYRTVTASNVNWVSSGGKKYVVNHPEPVLNFIQKQSFEPNKDNWRIGSLFLTLDGIKYVYYNVPIVKHWGLVDAENKGQYFNENIKPYYGYTRLSSGR